MAQRYQKCYGRNWWFEEADLAFRQQAYTRSTQRILSSILPMLFTHALSKRVYLDAEVYEEPKSWCRKSDEGVRKAQEMLWLIFDTL